MIRSRVRGTYQEYLAHQASKAASEVFQAHMAAERPERVEWFREQFSTLKANHGTAMCLGARYGEEVEALRSLGWKSEGIDIAAHPPWVKAGDMNEPLAKRYELVYTNAFDHCWNPWQFAENVVAAVKPGGVFMLHVSSGPAGEYETIEWDSVRDVAEVFRRRGVNLIGQRVPEFYGLDTEIVGTLDA